MSRFRPRPRFECQGKVSFSTYARADKAAQGLRRNKGDVVHAYRCGQCGGFHVGGVPRRRPA